MKKYVVFILFLLFVLNSCSVGKGLKTNTNDNKIYANDTVEIIAEAINEKDDEKLISIFSKATQDSSNSIHIDVETLFDFIHGDVLTYTDATDAGIVASTDFEHGKSRKEIQPCFTLTTTEGSYHFAFKQCIVDGFNKDNVGVTSICVIASADWTEDYIYRGGSNWRPGIYIEFNSSLS